MVEEIINYNNLSEFNSILNSEVKRQNKDIKELKNTKISYLCKYCKKKTEKWLNDPLTKDLICSFDCLIGLKKKDFYDDNSSLVKKECLLCAKLFNSDKYGEFCSINCKNSYEKIMNN
ncbi:MAG: hypothetical protein ACOC3X_00195 [Nanoarchaeota archaeon]